MKPVLYPTPFSQHWDPVMARVYGGWLPQDLDGLTHRQLGLLFTDMESLADGS